MFSKSLMKKLSFLSKHKDFKFKRGFNELFKCKLRENLTKMSILY